MAPRRFLPALLLLFVGSGCAALIYEVVWFQLLQLVIGSSAVSLGVLLGTFMGGMCLGSLLLPRLRVARGQHPLRVYACLELGIGAIGLLVLLGMPLVSGIYTAWAGSGVVGILLRGVAAGVCLLPPTLLMGATLPAISRWVESTPEGVSWLGFFYGGNIAGGVLGSLLAGFYLLRVFDMAVATYVAVALNVIVAGLALLIARSAPAAHDAPVEDAAPPARASATWAVYVAIALSGMTALGAEVIWTRLLSLLFGATVYTFALILAVFLFGLGIGSSIGSAIGRSTSASARRARLVPDALVRRDRMGVVHADGLAAVLADQPVDHHRRLVQLPARSRPLSLGRPPRRDPVGRELPARARRPSPRAVRIRRGSWAACMQRTPSARSRAR